jgi:hypothetical protein
MPHDFTPLLLPNNSSGHSAPNPFRLSVLPQATSSQAVSFAKSNCHGSLPTGASAASPGKSTAPAQPTITVQREGTRITFIRIECVCGQVIELACDY